MTSTGRAAIRAGAGIEFAEAREYVESQLTGDDITIAGPTPLRGAPTDSLDDHRLAMTFAIAGLVATGSTSIARSGSASISYPGFFPELERLRA